MAGVAASGGSTNGVLHLLAIANEAGVPLTLDELAAIGERTPVLASLAPGRQLAPTEFQQAGGTATLIRELVRGGHIDGAAPTVVGSTLAERLRPRPSRTGTCCSRSRSRSRPAARSTRSAATSRRRQPRQSLRHDADAAIRPCSCLRQRGGLRERRALRRSCSRATCSSCATKAPPAARGCARC